MALVVTTGKAIIAKRLIGATPAQAEPQYQAIGTGTTAEAAAQTALVTEYTTGTWTGYARVAGTTSTVTTTNTNDTYQNVATFTAPSAVSPAESGLFDALTVGTMLCRATFTAVALATGDSLQLTWKVQMT